MIIYCEVCREKKLEIPTFTPYNIKHFLINYFCDTCKEFRFAPIHIT